MAKILGILPFTGKIGPTDESDTFAVTDTYYGIDGLRSFSGNTEELNNIPTERRRAGMIASIVSGDTRKYYHLNEEPWSDDLSDWTYIPLFESTTGSTEGAPITLTSPSPTWNVFESLNANITLTGDTTLSFSNISAGDKGTLIVTQDGTGSHSLIPPAGSLVAENGSGGLNISSAPSSVDMLEYYYNGANYFWKITQNFT